MWQAVHNNQDVHPALRDEYLTAIRATIDRGQEAFVAGNARFQGCRRRAWEVIQDEQQRSLPDDLVSD